MRRGKTRGTVALDPSESRKESGYIVVVTALLLVTFLGFVALAADFGILYSSRTELQSIADSAALAGASTFVFQPSALQPDTAQAAALATATSQSALGRDITPSQVSVNVDVANSFVEVDILRNDSVFFAKALGLDQVTQAVEAFAEAAFDASGAHCVKPWYLPSSIIADDSACDELKKKAQSDCRQSLTCDQCGRDPTDASSSGMQLLLYDTGGGNYEKTAFALTQLGTRHNIRPTNPKSALAPGNFYSLRFQGNSGAKDYKKGITGCQQLATAFCNDCLQMELGNMQGPTIDGTNQLTSLGHELFPPSVTGDPLDRYCFGPTLATCSFNGSPQIASIPVWDVCSTPGVGGCPSQDFCADNDSDGVPDAKFNGKVALRLAGFATAFVHGVVGDDVQATILDVKTCSSAGPAMGGGVPIPGPLGVPVRLVSTRPPK